MVLKCENVYMYNFSANRGMRFKFKLNYEQYTKDNERMHRRIGAEIRERFGPFDPTKLLESLTSYYDGLTANPETSRDVIQFAQQFLVYGYVNFMKMSSIWESPIEFYNAPGLHIIIAEWTTEDEDYRAKAVLVKSAGTLTDDKVKGHILRSFKEEGQEEAYKGFSAALAVS